MQNCGPSGYYQNFAYPYCTKFVETAKEYSSGTQIWLARVASCLREEVANLPTQISCPNLQDLAIESHYFCYIDTGFCNVPTADKFKVLRVVYKELENPHILDIFLRVAAKCAEVESAN